MIPQDPVILLGYLNMKLRDEGIPLSQLLEELDLSEEEVTQTLGACGYTYDPENNRFR